MKSLLITCLLCLSSQAKALDYDLPLFKCDKTITIQQLPQLKDRINTISNMVLTISNEFKIDPCLVFAITWTETHFKTNQISSKGARGLMQVMPKTKEMIYVKMGIHFNRLLTANLGKGLSSNEVRDIILGTYYLKYLLNKFKGNKSKAILAYNIGPANVYKQIKHKGAIDLTHMYLVKVQHKVRLLAFN